MSTSPHILGATIERQLEPYKEEYTDTVNTLKKDNYVDDIIIIIINIISLFIVDRIVKYW